MKLKTVALGAAAAGLVAAEAVNLYKQVMGRGDRPKRPMTRLMEMKDKDDYAMADAWRQKYTDWVNTQPVENCTITSDRGDLLRGYSQTHDRSGRGKAQDSQPPQVECQAPEGCEGEHGECLPCPRADCRTAF